MIAKEQVSITSFGVVDITGSTLKEPSAGQQKDILVVRLRNMDDSNVQVYGLAIKSSNDAIGTCKDTKEWEIERCVLNEAIFATNKPVAPGEKAYFTFEVNIENPVLIWEVYDSERHLFNSGSLRPLNMR